MKKTFFNVIAALALLCGVFAFSGCADYETDINNLNERLDALETGKIADVESQLASLQEALASAESAIDAIDALNLEEVKATVEELQGTVNEIESSLSDYATLDYVNATFATKDAVADLNSDLGALENRVEALEGLYDSDVKISEILDKIDDAQKDASDALGQIKSLQDALGVYAQAGKLQEALDSKLDIADFDAKFEEALQAALDQNGEITQAIAKAINEVVDEFNALFAQRLTSVSLIPTAYLDGVPAIKFNAYAYTVKTVITSASGETVRASIDTTRIAAEAAEVQYHISPSKLSDDDIKTPEYLVQSAEMITTRAGADGIVLNVTDYSIAEDILTVSVRRNAGVSLNHREDNQIYTAALKVPVADRNLVEGETEANVYSEYSALYEDEVTPYIAAVIDMYKDQKSYNCRVTPNHFYEYAELAKDNNIISYTSAYNKDIDLMAMVIGCEGDDKNAHNIINKSTLKANGLAFRFYVPETEFAAGDNAANQQEFAYVVENYAAGTAILKSTAPGATAGIPNQASIGKTPIVRVELVDTLNDNIVDVRYFKVKWTQEPIVPAEGEDLDVIDNFEYELSCSNFSDEVLWDTFVKEILTQLTYNDKAGISYTDFVNVYKSDNAKVTTKIYTGTDLTTINNAINGETTADVFDRFGDAITSAYTVYWDDNAPTYDRNAAAIDWTITPAQFGSIIDGENVENLTEGEEIAAVLMRIVLESNDDYNGDLTFYIKVSVKVPELPELVGLIEPDWLVPGELARVRPVQYKSDNATEFVTYNYDLTTLFRTNASGVVMNNVVPPTTTDPDLSCRAWSFQYSKDQATHYIPGFNVGSYGNIYANNDQGLGYELWSSSVNGVLANYMVYDNNESILDDWHQEAHDVISLRLTGTPWPEAGNGHHKGTDEAIALLESIFVDGTFDYENNADKYENRVTINAWGRINGYNHVIVKTFDVVYIKPLYIMQKESNQFFEDGYMGGRSVNVEDLFTAVDSWRYPVSIYYNDEAETEEEIDANALMHYYDIQTPDFDLENARISLELVGNNWKPMANAADLTEAQINTLPLLSNTDFNASINEEDTDGDGNKELVFKSEFGWNLEQIVYVYVEVSVEHKWGTESMWVRIPVYPHGEAPVTE